MSRLEVHPLLLSLERVASNLPGEDWCAYRQRMALRIEPVRREAEDIMGVALTPLFAASALYGWCTDEAIQRLASEAWRLGVHLINWGKESDGRKKDNLERTGLSPGHSEVQIGSAEPTHKAEFRRAQVKWERSRQGVRVAVLDSGVDAEHPFLTVTESVSTCPESSGIAGRHGTHCAGLIASGSPDYPGIAPGVCLLDVKVARASGSTMPGWLAQGIDAALDLRADVLSISFGLNHLPAHLIDGHGWTCSGDCILCRAVNCAFSCGAVVVASAGNKHLRVQALRERGEILSAEAELLCPARSTGAISVGALNGALAGRYPPSSEGMSGSGKPEILAPGVDVRSTIPVPRNMAVSDFDLFDGESGTSVATAIVAGAVALIIERHRALGLPCSPLAIRRELLEHYTLPITADVSAPGLYSLDLFKLLGGSCHTLFQASSVYS